MFPIAVKIKNLKKWTIKFELRCSNQIIGLGMFDISDVERLVCRVFGV